MGFLPSNVESDENLSFEILEISESESLALDVLDELVGSFQFGIGIRQFKGICDVLLVLAEGFEYFLESRINIVKMILNQPKEFLHPFLLKVEQEELVEIIVKAELI